MTQDVTTPVQIEAGRECGCPPWVLRCAHWDGAGVVWVGPHGSPHDRHVMVRYAVYSMSEWHKCQLCGDLMGHGLTAFYTGNDEAAALEAFHAAEERLLRGEPS